FTWTFFLRTKDETSSILSNFITEIENLKDLKVKIIRCDNGGEFKNKEMNEFCTKKGIRREFNNARTPQQNRFAERRNRTLIEAVRTMLADAKLPVTFWAEAVNTACYVQNRVLVNKSQNKTPYELFNSRIPAIRFLRPFGCHVMILNTLDHLGKFDAKGDEGYFVGYSLSSKAFRVFNKRTKKVEENLHVDFLKNKLIEKGAGPNWLFDIDTLTNYMNYVPVVVVGKSSTNISGTKDVASQDVKKDVSSLRYIALPNWFYKAHMETRNGDALDSCNANNPKSSGISNPTSTLTVPPAEQVEPVVSLTVETKIRTISSPVRTVCLDISAESLKVFAPVIRIEAIRLFLAYALFMGFIVYQMDVKSAFLYGTINEEVYVMQPPGFQDPEFPDRVYKVEKAMYGLHQAPRAWYVV
nr:ribonuclease H-like domain-containing protein [Tanacetum cinerariifolium]